MKIKIIEINTKNNLRVRDVIFGAQLSLRSMNQRSFTAKTLLRLDIYRKLSLELACSSDKFQNGGQCDLISSRQTVRWQHPEVPAADTTTLVFQTRMGRYVDLKIKHRHIRIWNGFFTKDYRRFDDDRTYFQRNHV